MKLPRHGAVENIAEAAADVPYPKERGKRCRPQQKAVKTKRVAVTAFARCFIPAASFAACRLIVSRFVHMRNKKATYRDFDRCLSVAVGRFSSFD